MRSNSFKTQEVKEMVQKEADKSRGHSVLLVGIIEEDF